MESPRTPIYSLLLLLLLPALGAFGQDAEQAFIRGRALDADSGIPLEFANVSVLEPETGKLQTGGITDFEGNFEIPVPPGNYTVKVDFLSYQPAQVSGVKISAEQPEVNVGAINLNPESTLMEEIEVVAEKSQMQLGLDKRVFNVEKDLARTGGSAADLLDNIPSVAVDVDGNVSLRGSQNVRILIDGKPSGLVGISGTGGLQLLQGNIIESIEIITNPSSKYDAEGSAGIINIILKKEKRNGVNGAFDFNTGYPHSHGAAASLNLRKRFVNLFGNFGVGYRERWGGGFTEQTFTPGDTTYYIHRDRDFNRGGFSTNVQVGADFFLNPKNVLTTSFLYRKGWDKDINGTIYRNFDDSFELTEITSRDDESREDEYTLEYNLNYKREFGKKGQELLAVIQYQDNSEVETSSIIEQQIDAQGNPIDTDPLLQRTLNDEANRNLLLQADYTHPFGGEGKFETGYRGTLRFIDNIYQVEENKEGQDWVVIPSLSNVFDYSENIHAFYANLGNKTGRFSYQAGLRAEYSDIGTELKETGEVNDRNYLNFFPSVFLGYELKGDNMLQASYSRRIRRPRFWDLNPFFSFSDARNIRSGNPNLDPEYTDSYEVSYLKYWGNASLGSTVYYRHTTDVIQRITTVSNDTTYTRPENLSTEDAFGLEFIASVDPTKWWKINGSANFFRSIIDGGQLGEEYAADTYSWTSRVNSRMTFWKKLDFQLMFNYRGPQNQPQGRRKGFAYLDAGFAMDVLNGNGTLNLNIRDVFNSRRYRFETDIPGYFSSGYFQRSQTTVILGFTYRLNQKKKRGGGRGDRDGDFDGGDMNF